jgi:hypothetical protein
VALVLSGLAPWAMILREEARGPDDVAAAAPPAAAQPVAAASASPPSPAPAEASAHDAIEPRWGRIERLALRLEPAMGDISSDVCVTMPRWRGAPADVDLAMRTAALDPAQARALAEGVRCDPRGCDVAPPLDLLGKLTRQQRSGLYEHVLSSAAEPLFPIFRRRAVDADLWTRNAGLSASTVQALDDLVFQRGDLVFLADLPLLCSRTPSPSERARLVAALARTPGLVARVRVDASSDLDAVVRYWGRGGRALLGSLARTPGGAAVDVMHLLPEQPRGRLYAYPRAGEPSYDCHWTSMNFDAPKPDARMLDERAVMAAVAAEYREVEGQEPDLGDVLLFTAADGSVLHSAVHVVEDIVYTKNGRGHWSPWVLSTRSEVQAIYFRTAKLRVFRHR